MSSLNTQLGYQAPKRRTYGLPAAKANPASGITRALAGVTASAAPSAAPQQPARPSYEDPYNTSSTQFTTPNYPTVQPTAAPGTPSTYTAQAPQAPQAPPGYTFDLETDPILQQIHATAAKQREEANAGALEARKQLAIQYGDETYGNSIDQATGQAAAQNPFSITKNLANQYDTTGKNLNENLNQHNLFYSGERINELGQALKDYQQQQAVAAGQFQSGLGTIGQNLVGALMGADQSEQGGYNDAWARALAYALAHPGAPPPPAAPATGGLNPTTPAAPTEWGTLGGFAAGTPGGPPGPPINFADQVNANAANTGATYAPPAASSAPSLLRALVRYV